MKRSVMILLFCILILTFQLTAMAATMTPCVGIAKFTVEKGVTVNADSVTSELTACLGRYSFIKLVDRTQIDAMLKEVELGMSGIMDPETAVQAGKVHGVQVLVVGSVTKSAVSARAVYMETQAVIATATAAPGEGMEPIARKLASGIETWIARENVKALRNDSPDINLRFWATRKGDAAATGKVKIGQAVVFHFLANKDGYVTIVDIQPGGDMVVLYPNDFSGTGDVKAGQAYTVPGASDGFEITVSEPAGTDTIVAFFTIRKVDWLDPKLLTGEGFKTVKEGEKTSQSRGLAVTATKLSSKEWESSALDLEVVK